MSGMTHPNITFKNQFRWTQTCFPMRMFQSVSGHSSEQNIANHNLLPTVLQLKCISDTISNWFENHQPQKTKTFTVTNAPFIQNSNQMASSWLQPQVFRENFFNSVDKNWLDFSSTFLKISQFNSAFAVSSSTSDTRDKFESGVIFVDQSQFGFATHSLQIDSMSPCVCSVIDHRWHQNVVRTNKWHTRRSRVCHWCSYHILTSSVIC